MIVCHSSATWRCTRPPGGGGPENPKPGRDGICHTRSGTFATLTGSPPTRSATPPPRPASYTRDRTDGDATLARVKSTHAAERRSRLLDLGGGLMGRDIQPIKISGEDRGKYRDKLQRSLEVFA